MGNIFFGQNVDRSLIVGVLSSFSIIPGNTNYYSFSDRVTDKNLTTKNVLYL